MGRCQSHRDGGVCTNTIQEAGLYCTPCRTAMVANKTWTAAHEVSANESLFFLCDCSTFLLFFISFIKNVMKVATLTCLVAFAQKRQSELLAIENEKRRVRWANQSAEKKQARLARQRAREREQYKLDPARFKAAVKRSRDKINTDPVRKRAYLDKHNQGQRKRRAAARSGQSKRVVSVHDESDDDDNAEEDAVSVADDGSADNGVEVLDSADDEQDQVIEVVATNDNNDDDSSGSDVEGIEFVDDEEVARIMARSDSNKR